MTRRLYHEDAYLRRFDAEVISTTTWNGKPGVLLDRTAFYPEAGGQLGDRGTLGGATVVDTQESGAGIVHVIEGELPPIGATVAGELDWARRRQHMAQHTAQHLLSGTLLDRAAAATQSARLGESALTIDVARDRIPDAELAAAEDLANDLIDDDLVIRAWFPSTEELARMTLRRDPKVDAEIRVVAIGDFDYSPCGGTHCERTSQLGTIRITKSELYKGMTRVTFVAARRGRAELFTRDQVLRGLASQFSCGPNEVPAAIDKLRRAVESAATELANARSRIASMTIAQLGDAPRVIAVVPGGDADLVRSIAAKLANAGRDALLAAPDDEGMHVVLFRGGSGLDCGALFKQLAAKIGGRGGGKAERAEGRLASVVADWPAFVSELLV